MTIYLSKHWRINKVLNYLLILCYFLLFVYMNNIFSSNQTIDSIMPFIITSFPIISLIYIQKKAVQPIMKKIIITEKEIVMISSRKKQMVIDTSKKIYYEKLKLTVSMYNSQYFILFSNRPFETLRKHDKLCPLCKFLDKSCAIAIAPYNEKIVNVFENFELIELGSKE